MYNRLYKKQKYLSIYLKLLWSLTWQTGNIEIFNPCGGYVFNNIQNIQAGIHGENIVALYEATYENGFYKKTIK